MVLSRSRASTWAGLVGQTLLPKRFVCACSHSLAALSARLAASAELRALVADAVSRSLSDGTLSLEQLVNAAQTHLEDNVKGFLAAACRALCRVCRVECEVSKHRLGVRAEPCACNSELPLRRRNASVAVLLIPSLRRLPLGRLVGC